MMRLTLDVRIVDAGSFNERDHPRGQPENAGEFARVSASATPPTTTPETAAPVKFKAGEQTTEVKNGSEIYHVSNAGFKNFADRPTWFSPFKREARGYYDNFKNDGFFGVRTYKCEWAGGPIATEEQCRTIAKKVWPDSDFIYSMFDERVGEFDRKDVRTFIKLLEKAGFAGAQLKDYSAVNQANDADTLAVFHPREAVRMVEVIRGPAMKYSYE